MFLSASRVPRYGLTDAVKYNHRELRVWRIQAKGKAIEVSRSRSLNIITVLLVLLLVRNLFYRKRFPYWYRAVTSIPNLPVLLLTKNNQGTATQATTPSKINALCISNFGTPLSSLKASIIITKTPPKNSPPIQKIAALTSGGIGCVNSTANSSASGNKLKDAAPRMAQMTQMAA